MSLPGFNNDKSWTLFLDRDGVINRRLPGDYVKSWEQFEFLPGVLEALSILENSFSRIIIVSNQQGIGKGLMTEKDLEAIHRQMLNEIHKHKGRIDAVLHCPDTEDSGSFNRKPQIGMALKARKQFPEINFARSIMAGDSLSDMQFGKNAGMKTVFVSSEKNEIRKGYRLIDMAFPDLIMFAKEIKI